MSDNDFSIIDIFKDIYKKTLLSFTIFFIISTIVFSTILLFLQKNYIKPGFYEFSFDALISKNYENIDFLLLQKVNNLFQIAITNDLKITNKITDKEEIFFNSEKFFLNTYFPIYHKIFNDGILIPEVNKEFNTNYELIKLSNLKYFKDEVSSFTVVFKSSNGNFDKFKQFINLLNNAINKKLKSEFSKIYTSQAKLNTQILNNLKLKLMNNKNIDTEFSIQIIDEYLDLLDKDNPEYLGELVKDEMMNVANIEKIKKIQTKSNRNFIILRSIILGLLISFFLNFFIYTYRLGFFNK